MGYLLSVRRRYGLLQAVGAEFIRYRVRGVNSAWLYWPSGWNRRGATLATYPPLHFPCVVLGYSHSRVGVQDQWLRLGQTAIYGSTLSLLA